MVLIFIKKTCKKLGLRVNAACTAQVLYHRFCARQSATDHDPFIVALTCIFLASKVEENWKSLEYVLDAANSVRHNETVGKLEGSELASLQAKVLQWERIVLNSLSFDVSVEHPHKYADKFVKMVTTAQTREYFDLLQSSWNVMNDSLTTTMCLRYPARLIAAAAISFAIRMLRSRAAAGTIPRPRFLDVVSKFEKQGKLFDYRLSEIRVLEEELMKYYETFELLSVNKAPSVAMSDSGASNKRQRTE